jgi:hypothetical protein
LETIRSSSTIRMRALSATVVTDVSVSSRAAWPLETA